MSTKVYDSFDTNIYFAEKIIDEIEIQFSGTESQIIDNRGQDVSYPVFVISTPSSATIDTVFITNNGEQGVELSSSLSLEIGDELILDFKEQDYTLNGTLLRDMGIEVIFPSNERLQLVANSYNEFSYQVTGTVDLKIQYEKYDNDNETRIDFKQNFKLTTDISYKDQRNFNSTKLQGRRITEENYNFSTSKFSTDWFLWDSLKKGNEYRIKIDEWNQMKGNRDIKCLIGCTFDRFERDIQDGELTVSNLSGKAQEILKLEL